MSIYLIDIYVGKGPEDIQHLGRDGETSVRVCRVVLGSVSEPLQKKLCFNLTM